MKHFCYEDTDLLPSLLVKKIIKSMMTHKPNKVGLSDVLDNIQEYLKGLNWRVSEIEEYLQYVDLEIEKKGKVPLIKIFSKFDELLNQDLPQLVHEKLKYESNRIEKSAFEMRREELKRKYIPEGSSAERSTILFDGFAINFLPTFDGDEDSSGSEKENRGGRRLSRSQKRSMEIDYMDQAILKPLEKANKVEQEKLSKDKVLNNDSLVRNE